VGPIPTLWYGVRSNDVVRGVLEIARVACWLGPPPYKVCILTRVFATLTAMSDYLFTAATRSNASNMMSLIR
jgi:hypothetical protein